MAFDSIIILIVLIFIVVHVTFVMRYYIQISNIIDQYYDQIEFDIIKDLELNGNISPIRKHFISKENRIYRNYLKKTAGGKR